MHVCTLLLHPGMILKQSVVLCVKHAAEMSRHVPARSEDAGWPYMRDCRVSSSGDSPGLARQLI